MKCSLLLRHVEGHVKKTLLFKERHASGRGKNTRKKKERKKERKKNKKGKEVREKRCDSGLLLCESS
jgi:hypothetical protein